MERACGGGAMRRWGATVIASTAALSVVLPAATAEATTGPSGVTAKGAYLLDSGSNKQLWGKGADTQRQMASTTKIMTAVVVLDTRGVNLDKKVTVKKAYRDYVTRQGASTADLKTGDKVTVRQLLYALMLPSGCDAAYALADTFGTGDTMAKRTKSFVSKMNSKARALGMSKTQYDSFDGISQSNRNFTTPRDMAKLARHAIGNTTFGTVVKTTITKQKAPAANGGTRIYTWENTNKLLGSYRGAIGIKTGTGTAAGKCLVFAAKRGDRTVVGVILNDTNRYTDAKKMLDWSFRTKSTVKWRELSPEAQQD
ncbi:D-alanyl-D-alanine carboxypeptidase family protein [Streptomyces sp. XD-27]|uniref:D-alanyl-D-alanine carboxypeptidase family protein n=1 Tax=Streptomyces sp. XD-27 TaxID=3062779 RepID=UPI0026F44579|nr:serine hydrolase [Streptomyces sp. XD-27]WKX73561.1 serine hydrolase [Streptomyces sp. XD-27]